MRVVHVKQPQRAYPGGTDQRRPPQEFRAVQTVRIMGRMMRRMMRRVSGSRRHPDQPRS